MGRFLMIILFFTAILTFKACEQKDREISKLRSELSDVPYDKREIWMNSCNYAVEWSCYYSDCAKISIEEMQDKICKLPEDI